VRKPAAAPSRKEKEPSFGRERRSHCHHGEASNYYGPATDKRGQDNAARLLGIGKTTLYRKLKEYSVHLPAELSVSLASPSIRLLPLILLMGSLPHLHRIRDPRVSLHLLTTKSRLAVNWTTRNKPLQNLTLRFSESALRLSLSRLLFNTETTLAFLLVDERLNSQPPS